MFKDYSLERSPLYRMRNKRKLAALLHLDKRFFYNKHDFGYEVSIVDKKNGGTRTTHNPNRRLKAIQKRLALLIQRIRTPKWLQSGKKKCSYITNGQKHLKCNYLRTMDISSFFDSVSRFRVYHFFRDDLMMSSDVASVVTGLVMYGETFPTGAPTSPLLSYWVYREMFDEIHDIAVKYDCTFTLYYDDMSFSSMHPIPYELREEVATVLYSYGLKAKRKKDKYYTQHKYKIVTGFGFVDGNPKLQNAKRKELIEGKKELDKKQLDYHCDSTFQGQLSAARQNERDVFLSF